MNRLKNIFGAALMAALLAGCVATPEVTTYVDPLTNQRTDLLSENELVIPGQTQPREVVLLNASRIPISRRAYRVNLEVQYLTRVEAGPLDILPGRTLTIIADGKELKYSSLGSMNARRERDGILTEIAIYEAQPADIETIANASKVTVLIQGKSSLIERDFGPENFARFKQFSTKLGTAGPAATTPTVKGT
jgi:hypothetical protein